MSRPCALAALFLFSAQGLTAEQPLSKVELSRRGKAAAALVELKPRTAYATAFCLHASGLFLTTEQVARQAGGAGAITLVLSPGLKTQQVFKATVVRSDQELGLGLLRVEGDAKLPVLPLGLADDLAGLMELVAFGYPFGQTLAADEYPALSVQVGRVTALRHKGGELFRVQWDRELHAGHSGGPSLDAAGRVSGVVIAGGAGTGGNYIIPVNQVARFFAKPDIQFTPPVFTPANWHQPLPFEVRVRELLASPAAPNVELILRGADDKERRHPMDLRDGIYRVTAAALPAAKEPKLRSALYYADGVAIGSVTDQAFTIAGKGIKLSDVRSLRFRPQAQAVLRDGTTLEGPLTGLDALVIQIGEASYRLNPTRAVEARFEPPGEAGVVWYTIVVTREGKELARLDGRLPPEGRVETRPSVPAVPAVKVPLLERERVVKPLPSTVADVAVGGGGRFLILHLPKLRKLAVFDVNEAKIVKYLSTAGDNVKFAAGMDKLLVALPDSNVLQRWSLASFEREVAATLPLRGTVKALCMGSASDGPLLVGGADGPSPLGGIAFLNIQTLKPLEFIGQHNFQFGDGVFARASADGRVFTVWRYNGGAFVVMPLRNELKVSSGGAGYAAPAPDGQVIFANGGQSWGIFSTEFKQLSSPPPMPNRVYYPAHQGIYYLAVQSEPNRSTASVHMVGDVRPLGTLPDLDIGLGTRGEEWYNPTFPLDRRFHFLPEAKLIITIPTTNDRLVLHRFDPEQALEKSGIDYLFVTSRPPPVAQKGETYTYQLAVKSMKGGLQFKLESGPKDMAVSEDGRVTWPVPVEVDEKETTVIITVRDADRQECFHTFTIAVRE